jgi:hypothetical protein
VLVCDQAVRVPDQYLKDLPFRRQVRRGGELGHIAARFGDDDLGDLESYPGDALQQLELLGRMLGG